MHDQEADLQGPASPPTYSPHNESCVRRGLYVTAITLPMAESSKREKKNTFTRRVGVALEASFLWLALLSGTCSGYPGPSSWQVLAPGAVPAAEHKMAKAFVVHLPIHTTQLEPVEEQRQPATVTTSTGGPVYSTGGFETHGKNQGSLKKRLRRRRRRRKYFRTRTAATSLGPDAAPAKRGLRVRKTRPAV
ncbi:hypothetical protein HPB51_026206 [Rhipicephalus microplus]|uniref:Uncharacterized protein n=1 Tax=Rhipicephalus microplus TaxID=6941 RepID=A0A9J6DXE5_RHIMP|nr:hypothetical protein HPB51_026206 [Rhipicephalus microplus]